MYNAQWVGRAQSTILLRVLYRWYTWYTLNNGTLGLLIDWYTWSCHHLTRQYTRPSKLTRLTRTGWTPTLAFLQRPTFQTTWQYLLLRHNLCHQTTNKLGATLPVAKKIRRHKRRHQSPSLWATPSLYIYELTRRKSLYIYKITRRKEVNCFGATLQSTFACFLLISHRILCDPLLWHYWKRCHPSSFTTQPSPKITWPHWFVLFDYVRLILHCD